MGYSKSKEFQQSLTPDKVIEMLKDGNKRFTERSGTKREYHAKISEMHPSPWAVIHRCMDSRVLPEIIFDVGIGDVFVTGIGGNIINDDIIGSMEFACGLSGAKLILILGHTKCIAIESALNNVELGKVTTLLEKISPAVESVKEKNSGKTTSNKNLIDETIECNVRLSIDHLRKSSKILTDLENNGEIKIIGAIYDVETGEVKFLNE